MKNTFSVDAPHIVVTKDFEQCRKSLEALGVQYKQVTSDYFVFPAKLFGSGIDFMVGIHGSSGVPQLVLFIEIFRPEEYYRAPGYNIEKSFDEVSEILRKRYGLPDKKGRSGVSVFADETLPYEKWLAEEYMVEHCMMDRFGLYESLHINFYQY